MAHSNSKSLQQRAEAGDADAQCKLALAFEVGLSQPPDYNQALIWWTKAAEQGSSWALKKISLLIEDGRIDGSSQDVAEYAARAKVAGYRTARDQLAASRKQQGDAVTKGKKILLVDDQVIIRDVLKMILEVYGYQIVEAENGQVALKCLSDHPDIALIILDLFMPVMNGFQFLKTLRGINGASGVPIVVTTALPKSEWIEQGQKLGVNAWLVKPFQNEKIRQVIQRYLGSAQAV